MSFLMSDSHCSPVNMMLHVNCPLVVISHSRVSLPFAHAVGEPGSVQAQRVVTAANGVTLMLIALMSVFSSLYTRPHCPIITPPPPPPHTVSAFSQPVCRIGILYVCVCVCLCTHGRECMFSVLLHGRLSMCIDFAAFHLHFAVRLLRAVSLLAVLDMKHVKIKGSQLKTVVSRTVSLITA